MLLSSQQNAGQNDDKRMENRRIKYFAQFKYFEAEITNQNLIQEEIMWRLNSSNACYNSLQNLLSSFLQSKIKNSYVHNCLRVCV
jgi:hypothetical protein